MRNTARTQPAAGLTGRKEILPLHSSVGYQVRTTHRMLQSYLSKLVEPHGVSLGMWYFLRVLWNSDGLTQSELSARVGTMEPTTFAALRAMEGSGLIRRQRNIADKRKINIFLTAKGRSLEKTLLPLAREVVATAISGFSEKEVNLFLDMLKRVQSNIAEAGLIQEISELK